MTAKTVIIIKETPRESILRDAGTVVSAFALILPGWMIGSSAMQWLGATLGLLCLVVRIVMLSSDTTDMTIAEARAKLDELEGKA